MSYSRWSNSRWYTFWCVQPRDQIENHNSAIFEVCSNKQFQAAEIRKDVDRCVQEAAAVEADKGYPVTDAERQELRSYMLDFLADVDERYPRREHA